MVVTLAPPSDGRRSASGALVGPPTITGMRIGVVLMPTETWPDTMAEAQRLDRLGYDHLWVYDHLSWRHYRNGPWHATYPWLAAVAATTERIRLGTMVSNLNVRHPLTLAKDAMTIDQISGGRTYFGIGAGWFERDYDEYGYTFGTAGDRLSDLRDALPRIKARLDALVPGPAGDLPILIGGGGEKRTLKYTAQFADAHNTFGPPEHFARKMQVLDEWCEKVERDPAEIERTVAIDSSAEQAAWVDDLIAAGADHIIVMTPAPFDLDPALELKARIG